MGYGGLPDFTEYNASGQVLLDGSLGLDVQDFRTYFAPWSAQPQTLPAVAAQAVAGKLTVEASWNGATGVSSWRVAAGSSPSALYSSTTLPASGFQTTLQATGGPYVQVTALGASGQVLASSAVIRAS